MPVSQKAKMDFEFLVGGGGDVRMVGRDDSWIGEAAR